jgi:hypothetical protein
MVVATAPDAPGTGPVAGLRRAAAAVGGMRVDRCDAQAALNAVLAARHAQAAALAVEADALARLEAAYPQCGLRGRDPEHAAVVFELMAALGVSQRSAANRLAFAASLAGLPALGAAARAGLFDVPTVLVVLDKVGVLPADLRAEAVHRLLAAHQALPGGLTRPQLTRLLGRIVAALDPADAEDRQAHTTRDRRVWHEPGPAAGDPATLGMTGPAERVALCRDSIDALARAITTHPDTPAGLTLDQARFDALDWLITGQPATTHPAWNHHPHPHDEPHHADQPAHADGAAGEPGHDAAEDADGAAEDGDGAAEDGDGARPPEDGDGASAQPDADAVAGGGDPGIFAAPPGAAAPAGAGCGCGRPRVSLTAHITVSLATLLGLDHAPGELAGLGPVPASVARQLAASASTWRRLLTDPADGHLITQTIRSYRPTAAVREFVLARAGGVCASRGCTARHGLQIDHDTPWPHGPTGAGNNLPLHQPHHDAKTCGAWCHHLHPDTGALTQTSPLGRTYTTVPLPPLPDLATAAPDLTAQVRARLHRLHAGRRPGRPHTTGPPHRVHLDGDTYQHRHRPTG